MTYIYYIQFYKTWIKSTLYLIIT